MESRNENSNPTPYESQMLFMLRQDTSSFFSHLPQDVTRLTSTYYCDFDATSEINVALQHAADAREEHITALVSMLEKKPHLLLLRGRVITPGGHDVRGITIYEYCLGAGDPDLANKIQPYFANISVIDSEAERARQYESYRPHIDAIMQQEPYDIRPLVETIKNASAADVTALLNKNMAHASALRDAMIQFRQAHAPRIIIEPCMHFNYRSLQHALEILNQEITNLYQPHENPYDKILLVWRQLIGFEMRRLPGIDRCRLARGLSARNDWTRTYTCTHSQNGSEFPMTPTDDTTEGLGWDFAMDICLGANDATARIAKTYGKVTTQAAIVTSFMLSKKSSLQMQNLYPYVRVCNLLK